MTILPHLTVLLVCQLVGEVLSRAAKLPVPGPVIGMLILLVVLIYRGRIPDGLQRTTGTLLQHLGLLFVPASVGVIAQLHRLAAEWRPIAVAVLGSTVLAIIVTGLVVQTLDRRTTGSE